MTDIKPLAERIEIIPRKKIEDSRGWFLKVITGKEKGLPAFTGEIYNVYSENGASRGGHYHLQATEWFTLLQGKAKLELYDIQTEERHTILLDVNEPRTIVVTPNVAHRFDAFDNVNFLLIAYTDILYMPEDTISFNF
ncbi:MAG: polysaccharide biosynthesis C-terminal domain-containing protein [Paludibacter sp.]